MIIIIDLMTDPTWFDRRDMSPHDFIVVLVRSVRLSDMRHYLTDFIIVLPFTREGWEGSYCLLFIEADSSLHVWLWGRDVLMFDSEGFKLWYLIRVIFVCFEGACSLLRFGHGVCWKCSYGIWNSNYGKYLRNQKSYVWATSIWESATSTHVHLKFRALVSSSQVQGNSSNWVAFHIFSSSTQWLVLGSLVVDIGLLCHLFKFYSFQCYLCIRVNHDLTC